MLDHSVPHKKFYMEMPAQTAAHTPPARLPEGYSFETFGELATRLGRDQAAASWAETQLSVAAFETLEEGIDYFEAVFGRYPDEAARRVLFVVDEEGNPVGTSSAWFGWDEDGKEIPILHWIATKPEVQGKGLGRAAVIQSIVLSTEIDGLKPIMLSTQTGSHVALRLYDALGFHLCKEKVFSSDKLKSGHFSTYATPNDYEEAMQVLRGIIGAAADELAAKAK